MRFLGEGAAFRGAHIPHRAYIAAPRSGGRGGRGRRLPKSERARRDMRKAYGRILVDAANHFLAEDGWAIASHIALSTLTSLFPFLIFVTALAGFLGSQEPRRRGGAADLRRLAGGGRRADRRRGARRADRAARRPADLRRGAGALFLLQRHRGAAHRAQPRLRLSGDSAVVAAAAAVARLRARRRRWRCSRSLSWSCSGR